MNGANGGWCIVLVAAGMLSAGADPPVEALDPAMGVPDADGAWVWFDALDLGLEGQGWRDLEHPYDRLPAQAEGVVPDPVWSLSRHSAGLCVRFLTDSPDLAVRWSLRNDMLDMNHMPATGVSGLDLYARRDVRGWGWVGVGRPTARDGNESTLLTGAPEGLREYLLYLPLYNGVESLSVGVRPDRTLAKAPAHAADRSRPVLFWGTSIVQGGCASRPGMAYPAILGRRLDRPTINLGFSGNGKMDPEVTALIADIDPAAYVIDCAPNMTPELIAERAVPLVRTLREAHPETPIVLVENVRYQQGWYLPESRNASEAKNRALRTAYETLVAEGVGGLHSVPGDDLLGHDHEATVDGVHPTDLGFLRMADAIEGVLAEALAE